MHFNSFPELMEYVQEQIKSESLKPVYYRGQTENWSLNPSINRKGKVGIDNLKKFTEWLMNNKYVQLSENDSQFGWEPIIAIAQHYSKELSCGTYYIDFTKDIDVASFFATSDSEIGKTGSLLIIEEKDIIHLKNYIKLKLSVNEIDDYLLEIIKKNEYSLFFDYELQFLSRLQNQKGVFLRWGNDGIASNWLSFIEPFTFNQTGYKPSLSPNTIYPKPNVLETEIEKYGYIVATSAGNQIIQSMIANGSLSAIHYDCKDSSIEELIQEQKWHDEDWRYVSNVHYPNTELHSETEVLEFTIERLLKTRRNLDDCVALVCEVKETIDRGKLPVSTIGLCD